MQISFYKPNGNNTGTAFSAQSKSGALWFNFIKQASWNAETKKGGFKANGKDPSKTLGAKMNVGEAASIIDALNRNVDFGSVHTFNDRVTLNFKISPYLDKATQVQKGYSFAFFKNKNPFLIGLNFGEAQMFKIFLTKFIESSFDSNAKEPLEEEVPVKSSTVDGPAVGASEDSSDLEVQDF